MKDVQKQLFLPESMYYLSNSMNMRKITEAYIYGFPVTCEVTRFDVIHKLFEVYLGGNIYGIIPLEESSIYPTMSGCELSSRNFALVGCNVRAYVTSIKDGIFLSRKEHMQKALESISKMSHFKYVSFTGFTYLTAFVDVGAGIAGRILPPNFAPVIYRNVRDIGFEKNDIISVDVLEYDPDNYRFELSRLSCLPHFSEVFHKNDLVECVVYGKLEDSSGYYVCINRYVCGIMDAPEFPLSYKEKVIARVSHVPDASKPGLQLAFRGLCT